MATGNKLRQCFNEKATKGLTALVLTGALSGCATTALLSETPLPLNDNEKDLSHNMFGRDEIDTAIVRKYLSEKENRCSNAVTYNERDILFYKGHHADDFSDKKNPQSLGLFAHEMTHIWQKQNWSLFKQLRKHCGTYNYKLTENSRFSDFCNEQQASMVQDYARFFLAAKPVYPSRLINNDDPQALILLQKMIEEKFPSIVDERRKTEDQYPDAADLRNGIKTYRRENNIKTISRNICP